MSTITRELAKLFRKITNSEIDADGNAHVVLSPADSLLINNARIALASLEAEPVAWAHRLINKRNGVVHPWVTDKLARTAVLRAAIEKVHPPSISAWVDRKMREPAQAGFLFEFTDAA